MEKYNRKETRPVQVGGVTIGGSAPVVVQSMTNTKTTDSAATLDQVNQLAEAGCDLVRLAIPNREAVKSFAGLVIKSPVPLIADIHFDARLAHEALESGAAKIRVNPGNIGGKDKLLELAHRADQLKVPIRIGVNAGSLEKNIMAKYKGPAAEALVESALGYVKILEGIDFSRIVVSLKASDVLTTIKAYRLFSELKPYPLHVGVTAAGPLRSGLIKGSVGIGTLLAEGLGDTIRVSLTAHPIEEVRAARQILHSLGMDSQTEPELISCPTCGRCSVDLISLVEQAEALVSNYRLPLKVAVMGCAVNGPGEAREADIGVCAGKKQGIVFSYGQVMRTVGLDRLLDALKEELDLRAARDHRPGEEGV